MTPPPDLAARRVRRVTVLAIGLVLIVLGVCVWWAWAARAATVETLDAIAHRHARVAGIQAQASHWSEALADTRRQLAASAYSADAESERIGADVQQRVRAMASGAGLGVVGSQILSAVDEPPLRRIPLLATLEGPIEGMHRFLLLLADSEPAIQIEQLSLQSVQARPDTAPGLRLTLTLSALQVQP